MAGQLEDQLNNPEVTVREGWLFKEGHMRKTWKKRWFQVRVQASARPRHADTSPTHMPLSRGS